MKQLLNDIQQRLSTVPALKYIDEDWGQLDYYNPNPPAKYPLALIDLSQAVWQDVAKRAQMGNVQVRIKIADNKLGSANPNAPQAQQDAAYSIFDVLEEVHKALHGWTGHRSYSRLGRVTTVRLKREDGIRVYEVIYGTEVADDSAMLATNTAVAAPVISTSTLS